MPAAQSAARPGDPRPDLDCDTRSIAVTGLGAVTAFGLGVEPLWEGLCSRRCAIGPFAAPPFDPTEHRTQLAAVVPLPPHPYLSRADQFACRAADEAVAQATARGEPLDLAAAGVFFGSSTGALLETEQVFARLHRGRGPLRLRRLASQQHNGPGDAAARHIGATGPVITQSSACASSTMAIGAALDALRSGEIELALAGGSDELSQMTYAGFNALRAVDRQPTRPFRADREGLSLGEGSGVLVLETLAHARRRGARVLALLCGTASSCDAHHMSAPVGDGSGAAAAMRAAIADAGLTPEEIDFLNVHGTGTPQNDAAEWQAIRSVLGARCSRVPVSATKEAIGHLLGASGAIEALVTVLCLLHGSIPPAPRGGALDPALEVDLVRERARALPRQASGLTTNLAFGGANSALVFRTADPRDAG
ncbi:MAG: beta-ketoacyl-[acyl-carrier-protein] synthase family protein [Planctomycetes bacterium]|nr:beta-ketoacyl-[acyl-carrier-protein] synthase family protein [Planctomycetota bacterium]MCB9869295.1 beta-ketoacyl-[acyl-carrier-protein] synthase family protein [Planctomycetota bacterium]